MLAAEPQPSSSSIDPSFCLDGTPYRALEAIGTGAYGVVRKAIHQSSSNLLAIKKIPRAFTSHTMTKRTLREVYILRRLRHENIITIQDLFTGTSSQEQECPDIYAVMDLMETDLHQIIHSKQALLEQHFQYFLYQILRALKYLHSAGIVHRDLKPSNLLVNGDCLLRLADFGMARSLSYDDGEESDRFHTQYVSTRWYRAPELLFSLVQYDTKVDLWSCGCIFGEMIMRRQLFPGKDGVSQVKMIVYYLGTPSTEILSKVTSDSIIEWIDSCGRKDALPWEAILPKASQEALDVMRSLMQLAPWDRGSAEDVLRLPYFKTYHDPSIEPVCPDRIRLDIESIEPISGDDAVDVLLREIESLDEVREPYTEGKTDEIDEPSTSDSSSDLRTPGPSSESTTLSAQSSSSTINRMETGGDRDSQQSQSNENMSSDSISYNPDQIMQNDFATILRKGVDWPLDEASTSSAPPYLVREGSHPYASPNHWERRVKKENSLKAEQRLRSGSKTKYDDEDLPRHATKNRIMRSKQNLTKTGCREDRVLRKRSSSKDIRNSIEQNINI